jgi:hypothetical protein
VTGTHRLLSIVDVLDRGVGVVGLLGHGGRPLDRGALDPGSDWLAQEVPHFLPQIGKRLQSTQQEVILLSSRVHIGSKRLGVCSLAKHTGSNLNTEVHK